MKNNPCVICDKHQDIFELLLSETETMLASHYPIENGHPTTLGYVLIEPKRHVTKLSDLTEIEAQELGAMIISLGRAIENTLGVEHVYVFRIGDLVPHVHFHLVPRYPNTPKKYWGTNIRDYTEAPAGQMTDIKKTISSLTSFFAKSSL